MKESARRRLRHIGFDIVRWKPQSSPEAALAKMLTQRDIDMVLDVGANEGQYGQFLRGLGFRGRIVSFEPLAAAYEELQRSAVGDDLWTIAPRTAIGNCEGEIRLNIASNGASSSILRLLEAHKQAAPSVEYIGSELTPIRRLDGVAREFVGEARGIFLKIDVQGYELQVLEGATELLRKVVGVQLELSFIPLYEGQALFHTMSEYMYGLGFAIWGIMPVLFDNTSGRLLQADVVFFRD